MRNQFSRRTFNHYFFLLLLAFVLQVGVHGAYGQVTVSPSSANLCVGDTQPFTASASAPNCEGSGPAAYSWSVDGAAVPETGSSFTYTAAGVGTHHISCAVSYSGCPTAGGFGSATVTVGTPGVTVGTPSASPGSPTTCDIVQFSVNASNGCGGGAFTYLWRFGDGTTDTRANPTHQFGVGTFTVSVDVSGSGGSGHGELPVTVTQGPAPGLTWQQSPKGTPNPALLCNPVQFSALAVESCTPAPISYNWSFGDASSGSTSGTSGTGASPSFQYASPGTYQVTVTATDGKNSTPPFTFSQVVNAATITVSAPSSSPGSPTTCDTVQFHASGSSGCAGGTLSYSWDFGDGTSGSGQTTSHRYSQAKTYTVTVTASDGTTDAPGTGVSQVTVGGPVTPSAPSGLSAAAGSCGGSVSLRWSAASGAVSYGVYRNGSRIGSASGTSFTDYGGGPGSVYAVTAVNGCGIESPKSGTATATPASGSIQVTVTPTSASLCTGQSQTFTAGASGPSCEGTSVSYQWYVDGQPASGGGASLTTSFSTGGGHSVACEVTSPCGCGGGSASASVTASAITVSSATAAPSAPDICKIVQFHASASAGCSGGTLSYSWDFGDGTSGSGASPQHQFGQAKTYTVTVTVTDGGDPAGTKAFTVAVSAATAPPAPTGLTVTSVSPTANRLSWNAASGASGYNVYRAVGGSGWTKIGSTGGTTYQDTGLSPSTGYSYRVTAYSCASGGGTGGGGTGGGGTGGGNQGPEGPPTDPTAGPTPCSNAITLSGPTGAPTPTFPGLSVSFSVTGSESCGSGLSYTWAFGDGATAPQNPASHAYSQTGNYGAYVTARDGSASSSAGPVQVQIWDFRVLSGLPASVTQGTTANGSVQIAPVNGYAGTMTVSIGGASGLHVALIDPNAPSCPGLPATGSSVTVSVSGGTVIGAQVCADANATPGAYQVTITGTDAATGVSHSVSATVTVTQYTASARGLRINPRLALGGQAGPATLLDEVGRLARAVAPSRVVGWAGRLHALPALAGKVPAATAAEAAGLHVWLGEYALAHDEQPGRAMWHFRQAQQLTTPGSPAFGLAAYDTATALFYGGAYRDAADTFRQLTDARTALPGYSRQGSALWYRHAAALAHYHAERSALGIPEPPRLDPQCGAAALASALQALGRPSTRAVVLASCRVTGEGSTLADIVAAGRRLGVSVRPVLAGDRALVALPKPLVAYVEHDHFISVVGADARGVSYLCSDCGMWPGGEVRLTWKQWHALDPGLYATVTAPRSLWDRTLTAALAPSAPLGTRVASTGSLSGLGRARTRLLWHAASLLRGKVVAFNLPTGAITCGSKPDAQRNSPFAHTPHDGDPVNLATGEEEYAAVPDLVVYNPNGPSVIWKRGYNSYRGPGPAYEPNDFGVGWTHPYNIGVYDPGYTTVQPAAGNKYLFFDNGSQLQFNAPAVPTAGQPTVNCTFSKAGVPLLIQWNYDAASPSGHYTVTFKDRSRWVTTVANSATQTYLLSQSDDRNGNGLQFVYSTPPAPFHYQAGNGFLPGAANNVAIPSLCDWPVLNAIQDARTHQTLLTIARDANRAIGSVTDAYGRSVFYSTSFHPNTLVPCGYPQTALELDGVSQIVTSMTPPTSAPARFAYGYQNYTNLDGQETTPYLHTVAVPSPTGTGTSTMTINYDPVHVFVSSVVDGNGNSRNYAVAADGSGTTVTTRDAAHNAVTSYTVDFDGDMNETTRTDGAGRVVSTMAYGDPNAPDEPSSVTDANGVSASVSYGPFGNVATATSPRQTVTTYTYDYTAFPLGELTSVQEGSRTPTQMTYWEPSGLLKTVTGPAPAGSGVSTVTDSYTYDALGNRLTVTGPGTGTGGGQSSSWTMQQAGIGHQIGRADGDGWSASTGQDSTGFLQYGPYTTQTPVGTNTASWELMVDNNTADDNQVVQLQVCDTSANQTILASRNVTRHEWTAANQYQTFSVPFSLPPDSAGHTLEFRVIWYQTSYVRERSVSVSAAATAATARTTTYGYASDPGDSAHGVAAYSQTDAQGQPAPHVGEPLTVTDNAGKVTHLRYDARGNLASATDALGHETDFGYNRADQPLTTTAPATNQTGPGRAYTQYSYGYPGGLQTGSTAYDEGGHPTRQLTTRFGPEGEVLGLSGSTEPVTYTYDGAYRLTALADGNGHATHYFYNRAGYPDAVTYPGYAGPAPAFNPATGSWDNVAGRDSVRYAGYDPAGHLRQAVDGNGVERDYSYSDPAGMLTTVHFPGGQLPDVTYSYDPAYGRVQSVADGTGTKSYQYDDRDDVTTVTTGYAGGPQGLVLGYGYFADGSLQTLATPGGAFSYGYDAVGRLMTLQNPFGETSRWGYQDNGWPQTQTLGNGVATTYTLNAQGMAGDILTKLGNVTLSEFNSLRYDGVNTLTSVTASVPPAPNYSGTTNYLYDQGQTASASSNRGQLTQEQSTRMGGYSNGFGYDAAGNPTTFRGASQAFNGNNQNTAVTYDGNGNPSAYQGVGLTFDPNNRLTAVARQLTAGYTQDGLRAWKQGATKGKTFFLYDGDNPIVETDAAGAVTAVNTFADNGLLSRRAGAASTFYAFDAQGNVAERMDAQGNVLSSDMYDAFGARASTAPTTDPFGYGGQWGYYTDKETNLLYLTNRYYDPASGRFVTRDPSGYGGGINQYSYVGNGPADGSDPLGLDGYWQQVGHVFQGYGDAAKAACNPVAMYNGAQAIYHLAQSCGLGAAASAVGSGLYHSFTDWTTTSDPRAFGNSFGNVLIAAATVAAPKASCLGAFGRCFVAGTPVQMADGSTKSIEDVKTGDVVMTRDPDSGRTETKPVTETRIKRSVELVTLRLAEPASAGKVAATSPAAKVADTISCTPEHPFFVAGRGFIAAGQLGIGNVIVTRAGPGLVVAGIERKKASVPVYNFSVQDDHTYFVGNAQGGTWVHNAYGVLKPGDDLSFMDSSGSIATQKSVSADAVNSYRSGIQNGQPFWEDPDYINDPMEREPSGILGDGHHRAVAMEMEGVTPPPGVIKEIPDGSVLYPGRTWGKVRVDP